MDNENSRNISKLKGLYSNKKSQLMQKLAQLERDLLEKKEALSAQEQEIQNINHEKSEFKKEMYKWLKNKQVKIEDIKLMQFNKQGFEERINQAFTRQTEISQELQDLKEIISQTKVILRSYLVKTEKYDYIETNF